MKNLMLLFVSFCVALGLYTFVHSQRNNVQRVVVMPVEFHNKPLNKVLVQEKDSRQIQVTIQGPNFLVNDVASSVRPIKLILPENIGDEYSVTVKDEMLDLPSAIEVLNIEPKRVDVKIENLVKKTVPVVVPHIGKIKPEYRLTNSVLIPDNVEVEGAASEVEKISFVHSEPLYLSKIEKDTNIRLALTDEIRNANFSPKEIMVMLKVSPEETTRVFENIEIEVHSKSNEKITISPSTVWVKVSGAKAIVENMSEEDVTAYIKISKDNKVNEKVRFSLPDGVMAIGWKPTAVEIINNKDKKIADEVPTATPVMK